MTSKIKNTSSSAVAIEIRNSTLVMAILDAAGGDGSSRVRTRSLRWRHEARSLRCEQGKQELAKALKTLVDEERLAGAKVGLTLDGEYCVTRVVTGNTEHVRQELALLKERSNLYLSLGPERKTSTESIHELDARHQHALLAVANSKTLEIVLQVAAGVGLEVSLAEPMLVSLCRLLGSAKEDADGPVLIVDLGDSGMELGISYHGQLLLGYRVGKSSTVNEFAGIVSHHLARLNRYCDRYYRYAQGPLTRVFLCGPRDLVESAISQFQQQKQLTVQALDPTAVDSRWAFAKTDSNSECCAALGTCLRLASPLLLASGPNLAEQLRTETARPLLVSLCRTFWPIAVTVMIALGLFAGASYEQAQCGRLNEDLAVAESLASQRRTFRREIVAVETKAANLRAVAKQAVVRPWADIMESVGHCMPDDVWLEKITADPLGTVTLSGGSYHEANINEFANHLKSSPRWSRAIMEGTWPANTRSGPATKFDIECEFDDQADSNKESGRDD